MQARRIRVAVRGGLHRTPRVLHLRQRLLIIRPIGQIRGPRRRPEPTVKLAACRFCGLYCLARTRPS
jgi:hypothetical protein